MEFRNDLEFAKQLDEKDELKDFRAKFNIPLRNNKEQIYFLGNSLGLQPKSTSHYIQEVLDQWSEYGVEAFFQGKNPWLDYHDFLTGSLSEIIGAFPKEIVIMNQLTVNLHLMMVSFYRPKGKRKKIICEAGAFPSDQYMLETHIKNYVTAPEKLIIEVSPRRGEQIIRTDDILAAIEQHKDEVALVFWGGVNYYTGQAFDLPSITKAAHQAGAIAGFDLAHSVGNVRIRLHEWEVDFACWCNYKYLNAGPGAVGGAYIHERYHRDQGIKRFGGWWGYDKTTRFNMPKGFIPASSAEGWQLSTPPIILFAALRASLDLFKEATFAKLLTKGQQLSDFLFFLLKESTFSPANRTIEILTPEKAPEKGCQVSMLMLQNGKEIFDHLGRNGVFADWREPGVIRVAPVPFYNSFEEVWRFVQIMQEFGSAN